MFVSHAAFVTIGFATLLLSSRAAPAQQPSATGARPGWLPREVQWQGNVGAADRTAAMATLTQIEQLLLQIPGLAAPRGFEILPQMVGGVRPKDADGKLIGGGAVR